MTFYKNTKYEIETPNGWKKFEGLIEKNIQECYELITNHSKTFATSEHIFFQNNKQIKLCECKIGDFLDSKLGKEQILEINKICSEVVYDIFNVDSNHHQFFVNNTLITKNCDEFAFVPQNLCLSGDTEVEIENNEKIEKITLEELNKRFNQI